MKPATEMAAGPARIRQLNRRAVLGRLRSDGPASRSELGAALGLSPAGISSVVNELLECELIQPLATRCGPGSARRGRPTVPLELNPAAAYALGLRLLPSADGLVIQRAWIDYAGQVERLRPLVRQAPRTVPALCKAIATGMAQLAQAVPSVDRTAACVIAVPGVVVDGRVQLAPTLPALEREEFHRWLCAEPTVPAVVRNDVDLSVLSELNEQPRLREKNFAYLYIGSGVGAGIALNGRLWSASGWAGEVGHIRIDRGWSDRASFEELLGVNRALAQTIAALGLPAGDLDALADMVCRGRRKAVAAMARYTAVLAELVQILNAVVDLDEVIIDFPSEALFNGIRPELERLISGQARPVPVSIPARDGEAALRGAALAALEMLLDRVEVR